MTIGERIKKVRKDKDLTQQEFCNQIGLKRNSISLVEAGKRNISDQAIKSICREFSVDETWLRTGEGEMFTKKDREDEIALMVQNLLSGESSDFKTRFISVLSRLKEEQWVMLAEMMNEIIASRPDTPPVERTPDPVAELTEELAELKHQNREILAQNRELSERLEAIEKEDAKWEAAHKEPFYSPISGR